MLVPAKPSPRSNSVAIQQSPPKTRLTVCRVSRVCCEHDHSQQWNGGPLEGDELAERSADEAGDVAPAQRARGCAQWSGRELGPNVGSASMTCASTRCMVQRFSLTAGCGSALVGFDFRCGWRAGQGAGYWNAVHRCRRCSRIAQPRSPRIESEGVLYRRPPEPQPVASMAGVQVHPAECVSTA
jgi:hypothetical protein